ncbi:MAG: nuclear transport factor 2 family protein [Saprospiraceae bacterium]|nr:nuclear transport factor 2 family protein [Saprospiraceae bacterium]
MKLLSALTMLFFLLFTPPSQDDLRQEIESLLNQQATAWNHGDIETFMHTYWHADDLQFLNASGPTYGWENTLANYHERYSDRASMGQLTFDIVKITPLSKKLCTLIGTYHLERKQMNNKEGHFLLVIQKIKGKWLIVADSTH